MNIEEYIKEKDKELSSLLIEADKIINEINRGSSNKAFNKELLKILHGKLNTMREDLTDVMVNKTKTADDMVSVDDFSMKLHAAEKEFQGKLDKLEPKAKASDAKPSKPPLITFGQAMGVAATAISALIGIAGIAASLTIVGLPIGIPLAYVGTKLLNKSLNFLRKQNDIATFLAVKHTENSKKDFEFVDLTANKKEERNSLAWKQRPSSLPGQRLSGLAEISKTAGEGIEKEKGDLYMGSYEKRERRMS